MPISMPVMLLAFAKSRNSASVINLPAFFAAGFLSRRASANGPTRLAAPVNKKHVTSMLVYANLWQNKIRSMSCFARFKVWISLHKRSNEKMPDLFCISLTVVIFSKKVVAAVVLLLRSVEPRQKATPSFDIRTQQSIMSAPSFTACW